MSFDVYRFASGLVRQIPQVVVLVTPYEALPLDCLGESGEFIVEMHHHLVRDEGAHSAIHVVPLRTVEITDYDVGGVSFPLIEAVPVGETRILTLDDFPLTVIRGMQPPAQLATPNPEGP